jgi:hypothetical protein
MLLNKRVRPIESACLSAPCFEAGIHHFNRHSANCRYAFALSSPARVITLFQ